MSFKVVAGVFFGLLFGIVPAFLVEGNPAWKQASPNQVWSFPEDHWAMREYKVEWWYFTGHLQSQNDSRRFAYQLTFFRVGLVPGAADGDSQWSRSNAIMAHLALSDLDQKKHWFSETLYRQMPLLADIGYHPDNPIIWTQAPPGTDARWSLSWNNNGFDLFAQDDSQKLSINLTTRAQRPLLLQGPSGFSPKSVSSDSASLYYSFTRLQSRGSVRVGDETSEVSGLSWMDRELTSGVLAGERIGWDWVSLQLQDGRDLMSYRLRDESGQPTFQWATVLGQDGLPAYYSQGDLNWEPQGWWTSPESGARYPTSWRILIPSEEIDLTLHPAFPEQENMSRLLPDLYYWEGAIRAVFTGQPERAVGQGFLELTGYGEGRRLPL